MGRGWFGVVKFRIAKFIQPEKNCGDRAVLVAISIPIFTSQLEKSREAVDAANIRAAYAEVMSDVLTGNTTEAETGKQVDQKQIKASWQTTIDWPDDLDVSGKAPKDGTSDNYWTVYWNATDNKVVVK